ncbi:hypothetical protein [Cryptosporangium sp. NPDC048952]|uniref:hypothetical protein n=1 Tax=Cryptosporangium sp. NPDC048952 TaxID=3363961 RepID=UPI00371BE98F
MPEELLAVDWDLPVTEEFVAGVRRGVRRRRLLRRATLAGAAAVVAFVVAFAVTGSGTTTLVVPPATAPADSPLGGFEVGYLPSGVRAEARDGSFTCAAAAGMRECRDAGAPAVAVSQRRYDRNNGGAWLWITVLDPGDSRAATQWVVDWLTTGTSQVSTFDAPIGPARVLVTRGSEATVYSVVLTAEDGVVISITGNAGLSAEELTKVARGISR